MKPFVKKIIFFTFVFILSAAFLSAQSADNVLEKGISNFRMGKYDESLSAFREVIINSNLKAYHSDAYFWIAKSYMALRQLDNAEENIEFFILNYPKHKYYEEALYQKGRLMFLQKDYENCIQESYSFIEQYPDSAYVANAYFWTAESLYELGRIEEAESLYTHIIYNYPSSFKVESANYRLSLIEQKYREESLVELLKLTHEEYLKSIEEFQVREKTYENALDSYQKRLSVLDSGSSTQQQSGQSLSLEILDLQTKLRNRENEIMALKRKNAELEYRLANAETRAAETQEKVIEVNPEEQQTADEPVSADEEKVTEKPEDTLSTEDKLKLLEIKSRALEVKSYYLKYLGSMGND